MAYYSASKKSEILTHTTMWLNLKGSKPDTKGQTLLISLISGTNSHLYREEVERWLPEVRGRKRWGVLFTGYRVLFGMMKEFWKWTAMMTAQHCECTACY